jgi:hypothetical protein
MDPKMPFTEPHVGATHDTGEEPVSGRVDIAVGPEISSWIGQDFTTAPLPELRQSPSDSIACTSGAFLQAI